MPSTTPVEPKHGIADSYPDKPIRIIVAGGVGGPGDTLARIIGGKLTERWGRPIVIDTQNQNVGLKMAARAAPDGYTFVMVGGTFIINAAIYRQLPYDPVRDFSPISLLAYVCNVLVVHPSVPVRSFSELIAYAKVHPGELKYASSGYGSAPHLAGELFKKMTGVDMVHVPYKTHIPAGTALVEGREVQLMFDALLTAASHIKAGEVQALAVTTAQRAAALPDTPTVAQCGLAGFEVSPAMGVLAPAGTPEEIIARLSSELAHIVQMPDVRARLQQLGMESKGSTPAEFAAYIQTALGKWAQVVKDSGIETFESLK